MDMNPKELLDIKTVIEFGTRMPEMFNIQFFKHVYGKDVSVRIRGLSNYEYDMISMEMYKEITDPATIKYVFNPKNEDKMSDSNKDGLNQNSELDKEIPDGVDIVAITKAYVLRNALIAFYAMKDYYKDLTLEHVKQLEGIDEISRRVNEKSGRTKEIMEKIQFFRKSQRESNTEVFTEKGTSSK